jgi:hypothetical protein
MPKPSSNGDAHVDQAERLRAASLRVGASRCYLPIAG